MIFTEYPQNRVLKDKVEFSTFQIRAAKKDNHQ